MYGGRIVEHAPAGDRLRRARRTPTPRRCWRPSRAREPAAPKTPFEAVAGQPPSDAVPPGCPFHPRCPHACAVVRRTAMPPHDGRRPGARRGVPPAGERARDRPLLELRGRAQALRRRARRRRRLAGRHGRGHARAGRRVGLRQVDGRPAGRRARAPDAAATLRLPRRARTRARRAGLRPIRRAVAMVFQDPYDSLDPRFTVREVVAEPLRAHGRWRGGGEARVRQLLAAVGLGELPLDASPAQLSGGQRQRLGVARALALRAARSWSATSRPRRSTSPCRRRSSTCCWACSASSASRYLFISHDLEVVRRMSDEVAVMRRADRGAGAGRRGRRAQASPTRGRCSTRAP